MPRAVSRGTPRGLAVGECPAPREIAERGTFGYGERLMGGADAKLFERAR